MSINCIAVGLRDDPERGKRLQLSVDLAKRFQAHLRVGYVREDISLPASAIGRGMSSAFLEESQDKLDASAKAIEREVKEICRELPSWESRVFEARDKASIVCRAHLADLVVLQQGPSETLDDRFVPLLSDFLVTSAGCPVLIVPHKWQGGPVGNRILVAWKNSKEAIDAVRGSLPFLCEANKVFVLADAGDTDVVPPGADIITYLGYKGIKAELAGSTKEGGAAILKTADDKRCDLIVMGAYSHTRLREFLLGSATKHVLHHTNVPVLMRG